MLNRPGKFSISQEALTDAPEVVQAVMGECIITRCEHRFQNGTFEYEAYSNHFDVVAEGEVAPTYDIQASTDGSDTALAFVRVQ